MQVIDKGHRRSKSPRLAGCSFRPRCIAPRAACPRWRSRRQFGPRVGRATGFRHFWLGAAAVATDNDGLETSRLSARRAGDDGEVRGPHAASAPCANAAAVSSDRNGLRRSPGQAPRRSMCKQGSTAMGARGEPRHDRHGLRSGAQRAGSCGSREVRDEEAAGSNPVTPTTFAQVTALQWSPRPEPSAARGNKRNTEGTRGNSLQALVG